MTLKPSHDCHSDRAKRRTGLPDRQGISTIFKTETYTDPSCALQDDSLLITADSLKAQLKNAREKLHIISVIENQNVSIPFTVNTQIPLSKFNPQALKIPARKTCVVVCQRGITSYTAVKALKKTYPKLKVLSLKEGVAGY